MGAEEAARTDESAESTTGHAGRPEADLTEREKEQQGERKTESWLVATTRDAEEEKASREAEDAHRERVEGNQDVTKSGEKQGSKDSGKQVKSGLQTAKEREDARIHSEKLLQSSLQKLEKTAAAMATTKTNALQAPPTSPGKPPDALSLLHSAKEPGVYFREDGQSAGGGSPEEEQQDAELAAAVKEAAELLAQVKGVQKVAPGRNEDNERVILIVTVRGFDQASLRQVPEKVRQFFTLLVIPYELLPLRRER
jgi:hypothetical protein